MPTQLKMTPTRNVAPVVFTGEQERPEPSVTHKHQLHVIVTVNIAKSRVNFRVSKKKNDLSLLETLLTTVDGQATQLFIHPFAWWLC